jgi:hypothetical protein
MCCGMRGWRGLAAAGGGGSSRQQQQAAAAGSSSRQQQQAAAAAAGSSSSSRQQQPGARSSLSPPLIAVSFSHAKGPAEPQHFNRVEEVRGIRSGFGYWRRILVRTAFFRSTFIFGLSCCYFSHHEHQSCRQRIQGVFLHYRCTPFSHSTYRPSLSNFQHSSPAMLPDSLRN